jgi:eukaryotic-like serine/threonine-protein kinase
MTATPPPDRWEAIADLFDRALAVPPEERAAWLELQAKGDAALRDEVASMVRSHEAPRRLEIEERLLRDGPDPNDSAEALAPGTPVGQYRIRGLLGRGGMGEVYLAEREAGYEHLVALKLLRPSVAGADAAARFRREQRILARLSHPAITPLLDSGVAPDGRPYLVLQYVEGQPLTRFADERRLGVDERLRLFVAVCRVVQYAHARLVIHRDLKPSNILVTADGGVRLLDFGIAKVLGPEEDEGEGLTRQAAPMTPERAAPEQLRGELPTTATDVWALGVLLTELLVARLPFASSGRSPSEIERRLARESPQRPSAAFEELSSADRAAADVLAARRATTPERLRERLSGDLDSVVAMALRWEPERRYASAGQFADDVERVLAGLPVMARPASVAYRLRRFFGRHPIGTTAAAVGLVALLAFALSTVRQSARVARERDRATAEGTKANAVVDLLVGILSGADPTEGASGTTISVEELLARGEKQASGMDAQPAIQARLWHTLGKIHFERSAAGKGRELLQRALAREVELEGAGASQAIQIALDLARVEVSLGEKSAAAARLRDLLRDLEVEGRSEEQPALLATALHQLSEIVPREPGEAMARRALALRRALDPPQPVVVADSLNAVGVHAMQRGDKRAAAEAFREASALLVPVLGEEHPYALAVGSNLAAVTSDPGEQVAFYRRQVEIQTRRLGPSSHQAAVAWNNLGSGLARQGKLNEALAAYRTALAVWEHLFDREHPQALNTRANIGRALELSGEPAAAFAEFTAILAAAERAEIDPKAKASYRVQTALALRRLQRLGEAEALAREALSMLAGLVPESDTIRIGAHSTLGLVLLAQERPAEAERELAVAHAACEGALPQGDPQRAAVSVLLGRARLALGQRAEGLALLASGFDIYSRWGLTHPDDMAAAKSALAAARQAAAP